MLNNRQSKIGVTFLWLTFLALALLFESVQARPRTINGREGNRSQPQSGRKYMLSVGIIAYQRSPLTGCVNDATNMFALLTREFGFDAGQSKLLKDYDATRANILAQIERYIDITSRGDLFVFFYSGHGSLFPDNRSLVQDETETLDLSYLRTNIPGFALSDGRYDSALVPIDFAVPNTERRWGNLILDDELYERFSRMTAKGVQVILISDSCHSGTLTKSLIFEDTPKLLDPETALGVKVAEIAIPEGLEKINGRRMDGLYLGLTSSQDNQLSLDSKKLKQGYFTYGLTQAIQSLSAAERKRLTYNRLYETCRTFVEQASERTQTPKLDSRYYSRNLDDLIFGSPVMIAQPQQVTPAVVLPPARSIRFHLTVRGKGGELIPNSSLALFRPEIQSVPERGGITPDRTLLILRTADTGESVGTATMILPGDYWIKVVCVGYRSLIQRVRLTEDPRQHGSVKLSVVLEPE